jgi:hypothetical protein
MSKAILALLLCLASGCAGVFSRSQNNTTDSEAEIPESYCAPSDVTPLAAPGAAPADALPFPVLPQAGNDPALLVLSPATRQIAQVIQVQDLIGQIPELQTEVAGRVEGARLRLLEVRQELSDRLLLALFDASSVAAELECEKGRAEELATRLEEVQDDIQNRRTVIALLADAVSGLFSGGFLFLGSETLAGGADIIGNILQGSFGYSALGGQQRRELLQDRNLLQDVWNGPEVSKVFPQSVWRFLNWPVNNTPPQSRREAILLEWRQRLGKPGSKSEERRKELFFGRGGIFTVQDLRHRAEMLERVRASVRLMNQDLNLLFKEALGHLSGLARIAKPARGRHSSALSSDRGRTFQQE